LLGLNELPNYWWSDEELAAIAHYYNHDTYIYNDNNNTGIIYRDGNRLPIVLYNVNKNTHWVPGTVTTKKSNKIPNNIIQIQEIPTLTLLTHNLNIKDSENDSKNAINNIQMIPNDYQIKKNKELIKIPKGTISLQHPDVVSRHDRTPPFNTSYTKRPPHAESLEINNNKQIKQTDYQTENISVTDSINRITKLFLTDSEGTPFSISPKLSIVEHNKIIQLLTEYKHIFTNRYF